MFEDPTNWLIIGGLGIGALFGFFVRQSGLCLVGAVSNISLIRDYRYMLGFAAAALFAITSSQLLELYEIVDLSESSYRNDSIDWVGVVFGGMLFGIGATLAGGDAAKVVALAAKGSSNAWIALLFFALLGAVAQYYGFLNDLRIWSLQNNSYHLTGTNLDAGLAPLFSVPKWVVLVAVDILLIGFILRFWKQHGDVQLVVSGAILGLTVAMAWYVTGVLSVDEFAEPRAPSAMTVSGPMIRFGNLLVSGDIPAFSFSISFVIGFFAISLLLSLITKQFKFTKVEGSVGRIALGGSLMGIGGTFGYGCNIGQGYSGLSTLSIESIIAVVAILVGIHLTTKYLEKQT